MAKNDMTILDMSVDAADAAMLARINEQLELGVPRSKGRIFLEPIWKYRERVREALRKKWQGSA